MVTQEFLQVTVHEQLNYNGPMAIGTVCHATTLDALHYVASIVRFHPCSSKECRF